MESPDQSWWTESYLYLSARVVIDTGTRYGPNRTLMIGVVRANCGFIMPLRPCLIRCIELLGKVTRPLIAVPPTAAEQ